MLEILTEKMCVMERRVSGMRGIKFVRVMIAEWASDEDGENIIRIVT